MMNLIFWNPRPTCWCLKFGSFVCCCNINERTAQCSFSWAAELEQFSDELQMVESMFSLFCLFLSHMATSHWRGDSAWLTATVVWSSGVQASAHHEEPLPVVAQKIIVHEAKGQFGLYDPRGKADGFVLGCYYQTFIQLCHGAPYIRRVTCCREYSHIQFIE